MKTRLIARFFTLIFVLFIYLTSLSGQRLVAIRGEVKAADNSTVEYAQVILNTEKKEYAVLIEANGSFELEVEEGVYDIRVLYFGDIAYQEQGRVVRHEIDLGVILIEQNVLLNEIEVTSQKSLVQREVDRLVFNVSSSILASTGDVLEAVSKTPGVRVRGGVIEVIGKSTVAVLVNDQLIQLAGADLSAYLKGMSASEVERIELMTNPPARYSAEGNSGLINIVLKKPKRNYVGGNVRTVYKQTTYPTGYLAGDLNYNRGKISSYLGLSSGLGSILANYEMNFVYPEYDWVEHLDDRYYQDYLTLRAGMNYTVSDRTRIGFGLHTNFSKPNSESNSLAKQKMLSEEYGYDKIYHNTSKIEANRQIYNLNTFLKTKLKGGEGRQLSADVTYLTFEHESDALNSSLIFEEPESEDYQKIIGYSKLSSEVYTAQIDIDYPVSFAHLSYGAKVSFIDNNSTIDNSATLNGVVLPLYEQIDEFEYNEQTQALYFSGAKNIDKWSFNLGARLEHTSNKGVSFFTDQVNEDDYLRVFPSAFINYGMSDSHVLGLSLGTRITRPNYNRLNPFRRYASPNAYVEGNPFLQPYITSNIEFTHLFKQRLYSKLYYTRTNDEASQINVTDQSSNTQATRWENYIDSDAFGLTQSYSWQPYSWLEQQIEWNLSYYVGKSNLEYTLDRQEGFNFNVSASNGIVLDPKRIWTAELGISYAAPGSYGIYSYTGSYEVDAALLWKPAKSRFNFSVSARDIFRSGIATYSTVVDGATLNYTNYWDNRQVRLRAQYLFGNDKIKAKKHKASNSDERNRIED